MDCGVCYTKLDKNRDCPVCDADVPALVSRVRELENEKPGEDTEVENFEALNVLLLKRNSYLEDLVANLESRLAEYEKVADQIIEAHETVAMPFVMDEVDKLRALRERER